MSTYELFYWDGLQGRGEFVRLVLEEAGVPYIDAARTSRNEDLIEEMLATELSPWAFAVPVLRVDELLIPQTVAITRYLGERHGLAPADERGRHLAHGIALTIADLVNETHDTHHPIAVTQNYEAQQDAAKLRAQAFRTARLPRFMAYLEGLLGHGGAYIFGATPSYADLAAFQVFAGLRYAFPRAMGSLRSRTRRLRALHDRIARRPRIAAYLASPRRLPFNESGIFRHYPELDGATARARR